MADSLLYQRNPDFIFGDIDGEIVAMHVDTGRYLHLNSSGSRILSLLDAQKPISAQDICARLLDAYDVDADTCKQEVDVFITRCLELNVLQASSGST